MLLYRLQWNHAIYIFGVMQIGGWICQFYPHLLQLWMQIVVVILHCLWCPDCIDSKLYWRQKKKKRFMINGLNLTGCKLLNEKFSMPCDFFIVCHPTDVCVTNFSIEQNTKTTSLSYYSPNREVRARQPDERVIDYSLSVLLHIFHLTLLVDKTFFFGGGELYQDHQRCKWQHFIQTYFYYEICNHW